MATMGRKKQAVAQQMAGRRARENDFGNKVRENFKQEISSEEHDKRVELLKSMGLLKGSVSAKEEGKA